MNGLPSYDELPVTAGAPPASSWGLWGSDDVFGCLNLLNPEGVLRATREVRRGAVFSLNWEMERPNPPLFNRLPFRHEVADFPHDAGHDDELSGWNLQSSTQWDGFRHHSFHGDGYYNGVADADHGVHHWARRGIVGRGVLADVGRWREAQGRPLVMDEPDTFEPDELLETLRAQGTDVLPGDVLLIRTGWMTWYEQLDEAARAALGANVVCSGIRSSEDTLRTLWNLHIAAVAADNPSLEAFPGMAALMKAVQAGDGAGVVDLLIHPALLGRLGLPIGEMWYLDALAADCVADGRYEFMLTSAPLNLERGVASPANALAIK